MPPRKKPTPKSPPPSTAPAPDWLQGLNKRLSRAEGLLDSWMDRYEANLADASPDASKVAELVNIFTLLKRILEIQDLQQKLILLERASSHEQTTDSFILDPTLFGGGISGSAEDSSDE